ncbi:DPH4-like protein [Smittium culicis]|uniref:DPH4-like protein n=1 Tax=Smittium culicis TaxID=133412 RepID=A0A1R1XD47_9FUNG|nr:DPH4-like protein [Smittium culicis]
MGKAAASIGSSGSGAPTFEQIDEAYKTLRDAKLRTAYDNAQWQAANAGIISSDVDLDAMQFDSAAMAFSHACRCGGTYVVSEDELEAGVSVVACDMCSLRIRILYQRG